MRIQSNWRIIFDPDDVAWSLLGYGEIIDEELVWSLKKPLQVTQLDESVAPFLRHGGNAAVNFAFKIYIPETVDIYARMLMMDFMLIIQDFQVRPLLINIQGTDAAVTRWRFAASYITEFTTQRDPEYEGSIISYAITAAGMVTD